MQRLALKWSCAHEALRRPSSLPDPVLPFCTPESPACQRRKWLLDPLRPWGVGGKDGMGVGRQLPPSLGSTRLNLQEQEGKN